MTWNYFAVYAVTAAALWGAGAVAAWKGRRTAAFAATGLGLAVFLAYIVQMWVTLERPPLRTMGETRLWYSFFLPLAGITVYARRRYRWILGFTALMATVFAGINLLKPEIHSKTLMPALQSPWFAPHVIVYMMAYALLGAAAVMAAYRLWPKKTPPHPHEAAVTDDLVGAGLAFMTMGMLMGALWAKEAWGHYWSWDPKETWAAATWLAYLGYLHYRQCKPRSLRPALVLLLLAFALLQMCWWGINYLPSAKGASIHTYSMQ